MKRVLFLLHGIGRHEANWSAEVVKKIRDLAGSFQNDPPTGFASAALEDELGETEFVELCYDDLFQEFVKTIFERRAQFIDALRLGGLSPIADIFTTNAAAANTLRDNLTDILFYRAMKEHRAFVRKHVALQMVQKIQQRGVDDVAYSVMAHSLGTAVMHDTLQEMSTEPGSPFQLGLPFRINNLFMVANTSFLLRTEYDPVNSNVRPFIAPNDSGYVFRYVDFAHRFDPVAQLFGYAAAMKNLPRQRFSFVTVDHFRAINIHAYTHYLSDARVHTRLFQSLYGPQVFPQAFAAKLNSQPAPGGIAPDVRNDLIARLTQLIGGVDLGNLSAPLVAIASIIKELI
jgi:hypothetical protein